MEEGTTCRNSLSRAERTMETTLDPGFPVDSESKFSFINIELSHPSWACQLGQLSFPSLAYRQESFYGKGAWHAPACISPATCGRSLLQPRPPEGLLTITATMHRSEHVQHVQPVNLSSCIYAGLISHMRHGAS